MSELVQERESAQADEIARIGHWIGGVPGEGTAGRSAPVHNPATGRQTGEGAFASMEEIDRAVAAAKEASSKWRTVSLARRAELFFRMRELVHDQLEDIARI